MMTSNPCPYVIPTCPITNLPTSFRWAHQLLHAKSVALDLYKSEMAALLPKMKASARFNTVQCIFLERSQITNILWEDFEAMRPGGAG